MQDEPELGSVTVVKPPYTTRQTLNSKGELRLLVELHFTDAADPDKRVASTEYNISLAAVSSAAAEVPETSHVSPVEADADVAGAARAGRPRRTGANSGRPLAVVHRGTGSCALELTPKTVVRFVTQELKYELPHLVDIKHKNEEYVDTDVPSGKRQRN